jgi:hypothetical protein
MTEANSIDRLASFREKATDLDCHEVVTMLSGLFAAAGISSGIVWNSSMSRRVSHTKRCE